MMSGGLLVLDVMTMGTGGTSLRLGIKFLKGGVIKKVGKMARSIANLTGKVLHKTISGVKRAARKVKQGATQVYWDLHRFFWGRSKCFLAGTPRRNARGIRAD